MLSERVAGELSDVAVIVEVSLSNRLIYDNALDLAVLELQVAVCPLVEDYAVSDLALFLHGLYHVSACSTDLAGELHVGCYCVDACKVTVSSYKQHEVAFKVCISKVNFISTVACQLVHACADDVALI